MKKVICPKLVDAPYNMSDCHISDIRVQGDNLELITDFGYHDNSIPKRGVKGDISISKVNPEYCRAYILEYTGLICGSYGDFTGKKLPLSEFLSDFGKISLDVMEESFWKNTWKLNGLITHDGKIMEFILEIYYEGDITYILK